MSNTEERELDLFGDLEATEPVAEFNLFEGLGAETSVSGDITVSGSSGPLTWHSKAANENIDIIYKIPGEDYGKLDDLQSLGMIEARFLNELVGGN